MTQRAMAIVDGPDKPALQWAIAYPDRNQVHFRTRSDDSFDAKILRIDELSDGMSFTLQGILTTGRNKGRRISGVYSVATRTGSLTLDKPFG